MKKTTLLFIVAQIVIVSCQPAPSAAPAPPSSTPSMFPVVATLFPTLVPTTLLPATPQPSARLTAATPSAQDEVNRIWADLQRIDWFDQYGYKPVFPSDPAIQPIIQKARDKRLENRDLENLSRIFTDGIYNHGDYEKGYVAVVASFRTVEKALPSFQPYSDKWGFKIFSNYKVRLTLYGMGGSYNYRDGEIILLTNRDGKFQRGFNPSETIIHEAVHIGVEEAIIQRYSIDQPVKERIVDKFVLDHFLALVPGYVPQSVGDPSIDKYLTGADAWDDLPARIEKFKANK